MSPRRRKREKSATSFRECSGLPPHNTLRLSCVVWRRSLTVLGRGGADKILKARRPACTSKVRSVSLRTTGDDRRLDRRLRSAPEYVAVSADRVRVNAFLPVVLGTSFLGPACFTRRQRETLCRFFLSSESPPPAHRVPPDVEGESLARDWVFSVCV